MWSSWKVFHLTTRSSMQISSLKMPKKLWLIKSFTMDKQIMEMDLLHRLSTRKRLMFQVCSKQDWQEHLQEVEACPSSLAYKQCVFGYFLELKLPLSVMLAYFYGLCPLGKHLKNSPKEKIPGDTHEDWWWLHYFLWMNEWMSLLS